MSNFSDNPKFVICLKCGCVYDDGRTRCADCDEFTRAAKRDEAARFYEKIYDTSDTLADKLCKDEKSSGLKNNLIQSGIELALKVFLGS